LPKNKKSGLTVEEFLQYKPQGLDYEWFTDEQDLVKIKVPKFRSRLGKSLCRIVKKENVFIVNLDKMGSVVWKNSDGRNTVKHILEQIKKEFPDEKNIDQRLFLFLRQMKNLGYITY
jgi:hypothetical protein